jgi:hypothetical protein
MGQPRCFLLAYFYPTRAEFYRRVFVIPDHSPSCPAFVAYGFLDADVVFWMRFWKK